MKELEDYNWFPAALRKFQMEYIGFVVVKLSVYDVLVTYLNSYLQNIQSITDLCSGDGQAAINFVKKATGLKNLLLTDKYPLKRPIAGAGISYSTSSVDVLKMEFVQGTCYTMFNAFHHFSDADKLIVMQKIHASGSTAIITEILEPDIVCLLKVLFITTVGTILLMPLIKPFSIKRLFFTYVIPLNIITIAFDGIVSVFKSRSLKQYKKLFSSYDDVINVTRVRNGLTPLIVIRIKPVK